MKDLKYFKTKDFHSALRDFFKNLNIPVNYIAEEPARPRDILARTFKEDKDAFQLMEDVYFLGMVDDAAFEGGTSLDYRKIESDYDGILIFGVTLHPRENGLPPTRSQLAEITRAFNQEFHYTPVVVVFRYANTLAFANAERLPYKQEWREGEKAGKVSLLRDIDLDTPHSGHLRILSELAISRSGKQAVNSFAELYSYWQTVFNVSLLNKKFYEELSNWYFWAIKEVTFPGEPTAEDVAKETGKMYDPKRQEELKHEHNAKNVIRLLTRFLFVWFIKEKKLIPPELFNLDYVKDVLVKDLSPHHQGGLFQTLNTKSHYYKAILQNLFFATLNQEMGKRDFRKDKQHMNVTNLLRYEACFKNSQKFIDLVEAAVPFMNGGLFECLDKPHPTKKGPRGGDVIIYDDGFSDRDDNPLVVPDYLFFGLNEEVDLSQVIGIANTKTKQAAVKGLINIFESYKFTIAENTPIEEDIALDPELLGKVFENLLASYNPETKTTARKQTGSFYTPREIVNYMVDESLIAYLKNAVTDWGIKGEALDAPLNALLSFDPGNPFAGNTTLEKEIIKALDRSTILDPACGSGAFPMGILQKMVHILQKLDPDNIHWRELQMEKALQETESAFHLTDKEARKQKLDEINEAFDEQTNDPDYARKLFLIENCIYGVDIQPIAAQISKLRFFISLVVDQKVDKSKENFGIRPLPNLETKFVAANTLVDIEKPEKQGNLFGNKEIKELEEKLKDVRHRIFSAKDPRTKKKYRKEDQALREKMGELLIADGWANKTAKQLAAWDPYDQNASSPFFDSEWMFGIEDGFDVLIGNPPYGAGFSLEEKAYIKRKYLSMEGNFESYIYFIERCNYLNRKEGILCFITPNNFLMQWFSSQIRKLILQKKILQIVDLGFNIFESAVVPTSILITQNSVPLNNIVKFKNQNDDLLGRNFNLIRQDEFTLLPMNQFNLELTQTNLSIYHQLIKGSVLLEEVAELKIGIECKPKYIFETKESDSHKPLVRGRNFERYNIYFELDPKYVLYQRELLHRPREERLFLAKQKILIRQTGDKIIAAIDNHQLYAWKSVFVLLVENQGINIKYLLTLLNSLVLNYFYSIIVAENGRTFAQVKGVNLNRLPIQIIPPEKQRPFVIFANIITFLKGSNNDNALFEDILNGIVFQLYFSDHMKEKQIDILQFVEKDFAEIMGDRDFEQLTDSEKEKIINQLHSRWTHPDSKVRNRIKLFAVRSPDILKPILESR